MTLSYIDGEELIWLRVNDMENKGTMPQQGAGNSQPVHIQKLNTTENRCVLSEEVFNRLALSLGDYHLHVGQMSTKVRMFASGAETGQLRIPEHISQKIHLYPGWKLNIWRRDAHIYVGPVVGVLVNAKYVARIRQGYPPLSARKHMQANDKAHCLTYFFAPEDVHALWPQTKGYYFDPELKQWKRSWFPLPTTVYDRGLGFTDDEASMVNAVRQRLAKQNRVRFINSGSLGKWDLYARLSTHDHLHAHLPKTELLTGFADVKHMLETYGYIFLKSFYGYHAREVMSIEKRNRKYIVHLIYKGLKKLRLATEHELRRCIDHFVQNKPFVVQRGIRVLRYNELNMDLRLLLVKDGSPNWQVIYNRARLAEKSFPIINSSLAKDIVAYDDIYEFSVRSMGTDSLPSSEQINRLTIDIALTIEKEFGPFGEMGVDMAIDQHGHLWFIEANSKPNKNPKPELEDIKGISPQFLSVLEYAKCLEGVNHS